MSNIVKPILGSSTAITITKPTMASSATVGRESAAIDLSSAALLDVQITVLMTANGTPTVGTVAQVFAAISEDGTNFTNNATGSDADLTLLTNNNLKLIGQGIWPATLNFVMRIVINSLLDRLGGIALPRKFNIVVIQGATGVALSALSASYTGITINNNA